MEIKKIGYPIKRASYTKSLLSRLRAGRSGEAIGTRGGFSPRPDVIAGARCSSPFGPFQRAAQEALSLLKANEQQIEQLHTLLEQEGSEDGR